MNHMIQSKQDYYYYIKADRISSRLENKKVLKGRTVIFSLNSLFI